MRFSERWLREWVNPQISTERLVEQLTLAGIEVGLTDAADALLELPQDAPLGHDLWALLALDDAAIEVDLTPNRGDCLSVAGIAREVSVLNQYPVTGPLI